MKALVLYATKSGNTKQIADLIAEGIRFSGLTAKVMSIDEIADPEEIVQFDAIVIGSATYGGCMMEEMEQFLKSISGLALEGKKGGAFGAYGWSGEAPEEIYRIMKEEFGMELVGDALRLKGADLAGGLKMAQDYGREIGRLAIPVA